MICSVCYTSRVTIDEFKNIDLRVGKIISAERIEGSEKLLKLQVRVGDMDGAGQLVARQIIAGIGKVYAPEALVGKQTVIVANLEPRKLMSFESKGMLLAAHGDTGDPVIVSIEGDVPEGSKIS